MIPVCIISNSCPLQKTLDTKEQDWYFQKALQSQRTVSHSEELCPKVKEMCPIFPNTSHKEYKRMNMYGAFK